MILNLYPSLKKNLPLLTLILLTLSLSQSPLFAHGDHDQKSPLDHSHHHKGADFPSVGEAWVALQQSMKEIETGITTKNHESVHQAEEKLSSTLHFLSAHSPMITGDKAKRLGAALKQALSLSSSVHASADDKNMDKAMLEFKKLQRALKLVEAQYPTEILKTRI